MRSASQYFTDAGHGVDRGFHVAVVGERRVRDLDDEQDVAWGPVAGRVEILLRPEKDQIRLRLVKQVQSHRSLGLDDRQVADGIDQCASRRAHARAVPRANGRHDDDFAVDELDTVARREDANLRHVVVLVGGEPLLREHSGHTCASILAPCARAVPRAIHVETRGPLLATLQMLRAHRRRECAESATARWL